MLSVSVVVFLRISTFVAVSDCVKVHVILLIGEEQEAEPGVESVDGDYEEDSDDVPLFVWGAVVAQMHVDLNGENTKKENWKGLSWLL